MIKQISYSVLFFSCLSFFSCEENKQDVAAKDVKWTKDSSVALGKSLAQEELISIKLFLKQRPKWEGEKTGTGLFYWVYQRHGKQQPKEGDKVDVILSVSLLDGTLCYETDEGEVNTFLVDKSDVESGVQEGIKYLGLGDKAKLIIPSHLGHGLVGDLDKIPPLQVLVVDIELVAIY